MTKSPNNRRIDILIPCASDAQYVAETLTSIQNQSEREIRVLVIDNACPHDRYEKATAELNDARFIYVRYDLRLPMTPNWQRCLTLIETPIFAMVHDDDIWPRDYLETGLRALSEDQDALGVMTSTSLFEGNTAATPSESNSDVFKHLATLPVSAQRLHMIFSFLGHMSAFIGRRGARGFPFASWWLSDQRFIDAHWLQGRCMLNTCTSVLLRRHSASGTAALASDPMKAAEVCQRFRTNAMEITRNNIPGRYDLPEFARTADINLLIAICNACLQWPARRELYEFVRAVLRVPGTVERMQGSGFRGKALTRVPFWMIAAGGILREGLTPSSRAWRPPTPTVE